MDLARIIDGKKFMWDGETYGNKSQAEEVIAKYQKDGFETQLVEEKNKFFVFSCRVVTEIVIEGQLPV